ncbi:hypothetical protein [Corynebacterium provencense]|uniref:hypothetical protein n=1 Tax=Corynebacterium provencense TaxID=1737425 RepID=UPI0008341508|nr:hypothetical protein [Corynebacterium provencense]
MKSLTSKTVCTSVVALATAVSLVGCSPGGSDDSTDGGESVVGVAATPAASPDTDGDAAGSVSAGDRIGALVRLGGPRAGDAGTQDGSSGTRVAALASGRLLVGDLDEVAEGTAKATPVDPDCHSLTAAVDQLVMACGQTVRILDATGRELRSVDAGSPVTAAAAVPDGTVVVTTEGSDKARWFDAAGAERNSEGVSETPSSMLVVGNTRNSSGDSDAQLRVVVLDAAQSSISDLDMDKAQFNASLRAGQGLGTASSGSLADGVVVVSDPRSDQALVYTVTDVVRHTQATVTGPSPWAVLWDSERQLMWVSTTGDNRLTAYRLSTGTPEPVGHVTTVPDVRYIVDGDGGDLLLVAEDGTRQLIPSSDLPLSD